MKSCALLSSDKPLALPMKVTSDVRLLMKVLYYLTLIATVGMVAYLFWLTFVTIYNGLLS
ncbi:hypothetical protein [Bowmanella pacifica]|nr:hypothetical protein [Bowmanella pacifica]